LISIENLEAPSTSHLLQVFRYNATEDRLELCLEPHGHFLVEPNIEAKVLSQPPEAANLKHHLNSGSQGVAINQPMQAPCPQVAFSGHGHTLGSVAEDKMPQDLEMPPSHAPKLKATRLKNFSSSGSRPNSIDEEDEESGEQKQQSHTEHTYQRMGPGYSVLHPSNEASAPAAAASTTAASSADTFEGLMSKIGSLVQEMDTEVSFIPFCLAVLLIMNIEINFVNISFLCF
jgi:deubiquitinating protein VCIP135